LQVFHQIGMNLLWEVIIVWGFIRFWFSAHDPQPPPTPPPFFITHNVCMYVRKQEHIIWESLKGLAHNPLVLVTQASGTMREVHTTELRNNIDYQKAGFHGQSKENDDRIHVPLHCQQTVCPLQLWTSRFPDFLRRPPIPEEEGKLHRIQTNANLKGRVSKPRP
jgi:hypothetical protein